ncbi:MAG: bifunctional diaminohydroxyphosphoribosylaminopyrimidine deaminase/5-amino-6-(5-phosphoribosylamino)uracil reductase RibD [Planctomycetota bacterium]|nr:bifunctional diaminohydroxyphosphoribosylaminopyrimidine deaminase/5-amino-6-(5-phosphoribosylamino)uracil reductase RibD [Planctomycetota bacterium]
MIPSDFSCDDHRWMRRALRLALRSRGRTWPNPGVGCVIVRDGVVLGEGRHERCGQAHGEVQALAACAAAGNDPRGATAYITLAPCTKQGRTPPCCGTLIAAGVARVVAAQTDPIQDDAAAILSAAGIAYEVGCEQAAAEAMHAGFRSRAVQGRPRFIGKWAATLDGALATHQGHSAWITSEQARAYSRRRRCYVDAILVGAATASADDPQLLASEAGRDPVRVILCGAQLVPSVTSRLLRSVDRAPVVLVHDQRSVGAALDAACAHGAEALSVASVHDCAAVAAALYDYGLSEVLVEGGARVHGAFLAAGLYDRLECYWGGRTLGGGMPIANGSGVERIAMGAAWRPVAAPRVLGDTVYCPFERGDE